MKKSQLKSILAFLMVAVLATIITYGLSVTQTYPSSVWVTTSSVNFNFTPVTQLLGESIEWCAVLTNDNQTVSANYSTADGLSNSTPFVRGIAFADTATRVFGYNWTTRCGNGTDIVNGTVMKFGVDATTPTVTITYPSNGGYISDNKTNITFTPIDASNPSNCTIYTNLSGSWKVNYTISGWTSGAEIGMNLTNFKDGGYIWNVMCNDTAGNEGWAATSANYSFVLDATPPTAVVFKYPTNNTFSTDTTPLINWSITTEANFYRYEIRAATSSTDLEGTAVTIAYETSKTHNYTTMPELAANDQYYILVTAVDLAGNSKNSTSHLYYNVDTTSPALTLANPSDGSFTNDNTPDFNVTIVETNPSDCWLYLSNKTSGNLVLNKTTSSVTNGATINITPSAMADGNYSFMIGCNDSANNRVNVSSALLTVKVDTLAPTRPELQITFGQTNSTDTTPEMRWKQSTEYDFSKYVVEANYVNNGSLAYQSNVTSQTTVSLNVSLLRDHTYNFSVTAYDLAGNYNKSTNTTTTWYYVDPICGVLYEGWNLCGAVWTTPKNLSVIITETSATFASVWNESNHVWATCVSGVDSSNCALNVTVKVQTINSLVSQHVWLYVDEDTDWENRVWSATQSSGNFTLSNFTNRWNIVAGILRNGRTFGDLGRAFTGNNVTMFSLPYFNGSSAVPYVLKSPYNTLNNYTMLDYGRAMWVFYNGTTQTNVTYTIGAW